MKNLAKALLEVQKEVGAIKKDATNPFFKSKYADINSFIETVKPILSKHGVVLLQPLDHSGDAPVLQTILIHAETGESITSATTITLPTFTETKSKGKNGEEILTTSYDPQKQGSAITYFRRYALQSMLFLQAEDDDGNTASGKVSKSKGPADEQGDDDLNF